MEKPEETLVSDNHNIGDVVNETNTETKTPVKRVTTRKQVVRKPAVKKVATLVEKKEPTINQISI